MLYKAYSWNMMAYQISMWNYLFPIMAVGNITKITVSMPDFLKLFYEKCVCMYVGMYNLFVFLHSCEQTFYLKLESSLYTNNKG